MLALRSLSLRHKMIAVNGSVLAIVLVGLASGIQLSRKIERGAIAIEEEAIEDVEIVSQLQQGLLGIVVHEQVILSADSNPDASGLERLDTELDSLTRDYFEFKSSWEALQSSEEFDEGEEVEGRNEEEEAIARLITAGHGRQVERYIARFDRLIVQINRDALSREEITAEIAELRSEPFVRNMDLFLHKVQALSEATDEEFREARETFEQASRARAIVLLAALLISGGLGVALTFALSKLLMRPLSEMTAIAQKSIQQEEFDLNVPVRTGDEAGQLAQTFNALCSSSKSCSTRSRRPTPRSRRRWSSCAKPSRKLSRALKCRA